MQTFNYRPFMPPAHAASLREEIRTFLREEMPDTQPAKLANSWSVMVDRRFSLSLAKAGFVGMVWPKRYGGHEREPMERYIVIEELLAAGAPVAAHWVADRQTGPLLLRYGTEDQKQRFLPPMTRGELITCIGLSEPGAGSDLAAVRTSARRRTDGWCINGQKVWTTNAHVADYMLALIRTAKESQRHEGLSQFLVDMKTPGITVRPINNMAGEQDFNEVFFDNVLVPHDALIGVEGEGWRQVTAELALERSGPERFLSSHALFRKLLEAARHDPSDCVREAIGRLSAELWALRQMSMSTAAKLAAGEDPALEACIIKDLGNGFEQAVPQVVQALLDDETLAADTALTQTLNYLLQMAPSFSLRGGTREVLRGVIARGLGLR